MISPLNRPADTRHASGPDGRSPPPEEQDERQHVRLLAVLCLCGFATSISWRALDPMMPVMASDLDVPLNQVVLLATAYSLPFALMQLVFGPLGDALGKTRLIRFSLGMVAASLLLMTAAPNLDTLFAARILSGAFAGGINPVAIAVMGERIALRHRQVALGRYLVAMIGGQMIGASAAGLLVDLIGWRWVVALAALVVATVCALAVRYLDSRGETRSRPSFRTITTSYRMIFARPGAFLLMAILAAEGILILGTIPFIAGMLLERLASGSAQAGLVIGCFAVGGMTFGFFVRRVVARLGPWNMIWVGGLITSAGLLGAALPIHWTVTATCFFGVGFGFYTMHNSIMLRVTELAPHARGAGVSVGAFAFTAGQGIGPILWTVALPGLGYPAMFLTAGVLTALLGLVATKLLRTRVYEIN
jgi:predicted MFS family arabinose efflux permease